MGTAGVVCRIGLLAVGSVWLGVADARAALVAVEDNNVLKSAATTVQNTDGNGTSFSLKEASSTQSNSRIGYVKFDLSSVLPADGNDATISIFTGGSASANFTLQAFALDAGATGFDWAENTITYDNRPAASTVGTDFLVDPTVTAPLGGTVAIANGSAAGTLASFPLTGLSDFRQSDDSLTMIVVVTTQSSSSPSLSIASSESLTPPTLTVVPEPAALGLLGIGAMGLLSRRRRV